MPAMRIDSGAAMPAPLPDALMMPMTSGTRNAMEKTGPMKPTDWATTSTRVSLRPDPPRVLDASGTPVEGDDVLDWLCDMDSPREARSRVHWGRSYGPE